MRAAPLAALLLLAGCGDIPQPFRHDGPNAALAPAAARAVVVRSDDRTARTGALAEAVVRRLLEAEIPATTRSGGGGSWTLIPEIGEGEDTTLLRWRLIRGDGETVLDWTQTVPAAAWRTPSPRLTEGLAAALVDHLMPTLAGAPPAPAPPPLRARLLPPTDLPGDGNAALAGALRRMLEKAGIAAVEGDAAADIVVRIQAAVTPAPEGQENLRLVWIVSGGDGSEWGRAAQQGAVAKGRLAGAWGSLATDIAGGGAEGILQILRTRKPP